MRLVYALMLVLLAGLVSGCLLSEKEKPDTGGDDAGEIRVTPDAPDRTITLQWNAPVHRADESGLYETEIKGYRVYYGREPGVYNEIAFIENGQDPVLVLSDMDLEGEYHFVVTTIDTSDLESDYSESVSATF